MRIWVVMRKGNMDWDDLEGCFIKQEDALNHLKQLEEDFSKEEYTIICRLVIE